MNIDFAAAMRRAILSTRASNVAEATRVIQNALGDRLVSGEQCPMVSDIAPPSATSRPPLFLADPGAELIEPSETQGAGSVRPSIAPLHRLRKPLGEALRILRAGRTANDAWASLPGMNVPVFARRNAPSPLPEGARFLKRSFTCSAGARSYRLYVPASAPDRPRGLVVMLHGCKQDPDDFAAGTGMNAIAEVHGLLVAYPEQTGADNASSCWNWFRPVDQSRDGGEPAIIAGIAREIISEFDPDRDRIFVAGLSAGGAMAAVMGETYPDLFSAIGFIPVWPMDQPMTSYPPSPPCAVIADFHTAPTRARPPVLRAAFAQ